MLLLAQSLVEYSAGSGRSLGDSIGAAIAGLSDSLSRVDRNTWLAIGVAVLVVAFLARRPSRR